MKKWYYATATVIGTIIGAGVLGIPYTFAKAGLFYGTVNLVVVALLFLFVNLALGEVMLRTNGIHQLSGYAEKYLGKKGKILMTVALVFAIYGALTAYLIGLGDITASLLGGQPFFYTTIFFIAFSSVIYFGIKTVSKSEFILSSVKLLIFLALVFSLISFFSTKNMVHSSFSLKNIFLPYGVVLFSLMGFPSMPEAREILKGEEKNLKKTIFVAMLIPAGLYALMAIFFMGAIGMGINEVAVISLEILGALPYLLGFGFAFLCLTTPYISLGLALEEMYEYDYKIQKKFAFILTIAIPYIIILLGVRSFVNILGLVGAVGGGSAAILIVLMFLRSKKKGDRNPEYSINKNKLLSGIVITALAAGVIYELILFFWLI